MRNKQRFAFVALAALALLAIGLGPAIAEHHESEAPGTLEFKAHNGMYNAHGKFQKWHFTNVAIPEGDLEKGVVEFEVDLASVWEKAADLAEHLRQADFFNVSKFTTSTVKIHDVKKTGENAYDATATVTLHGHTKDVPVSFTVVGSDPLQIEGEATLSRTAFGIGEPHDPESDRSIVDDVQVMISATIAE